MRHHLLSLAAGISLVVADTTPSSGKHARNEPFDRQTAWGGAVHQNGVPGNATDHFTGVFGQFRVPEVTMPDEPRADGNYLIAVWAGLDGAQNHVVWQAGVNAQMSNGTKQATPTYFAWYEWFPAQWKVLPKFPVAPGDLVSVNVSMVTNTTGEITIENVSQRYTANICGEVPWAGAELTGSSAEWVVEAPGKSVPHFADIPWTSCQYRTASGVKQVWGLAGASIYDMIDPDLATNTTITSEDTMTIRYVRQLDGQ